MINSLISMSSSSDSSKCPWEAANSYFTVGRRAEPPPSLLKESCLWILPLLMMLLPCPSSILSNDPDEYEDMLIPDFFTLELIITLDSYLE